MGPACPELPPNDGYSGAGMCSAHCRRALARTAADRRPMLTCSPHTAQCQATHGNTEAVKALLAEGGSQGIKDASGSTALFAAADAGHPEVLKLLLAAAGGKKDLETTGKDGNTPLAVAAQSGHEEVVRVLLAAGAARDAANEKKETPMSLAVSWGGHLGVWEDWGGASSERV